MSNMRERIASVKRMVYDYTDEEISAETGATIGTIKQWRYKLRAPLKSVKNKRHAQDAIKKARLRLWPCGLPKSEHVTCGHHDRCYHDCKCPDVFKKNVANSANKKEN